MTILVSKNYYNILVVLENSLATTTYFHYFFLIHQKYPNIIILGIIRVPCKVPKQQKFIRKVGKTDQNIHVLHYCRVNKNKVGVVYRASSELKIGIFKKCSCSVGTYLMVRLN